MFTPTAVHYPATSNPDDILVSGVDDTHGPTNAPIITDAVLAKQFAETPAMIPNPAYQPLVDQAFALATAAIAAQAELMK